MMQEIFHLIGYASGIAGADEHCSGGPDAVQQSVYLKALMDKGLPLVWEQTVRPDERDLSSRPDQAVRQINEKLAHLTATLTRQNQFFSIIGGDHTSAIGTWSGVQDVKREAGEIGLIWIDAHMDSHTPETTESGRIHGMPLAALLGFGYPTLTTILNHSAKFKPENVCLIGVRSYEKGEAALLKRLNIRTYMMEEVSQRGFITVLQEAIQLVSRHTIGYGLSIDLDALDPKDAPGVDVPEPNGIHANDLISGLSDVLPDPRLLGVEIVEFDPTKDKAQLTEKLIAQLIDVIATKVLSHAKA